MDLTFPWLPRGFFGEQGGLLTALLIGAVFGFALERAGFGNGRKLAAQFYLYDMTVFKVMFTAIVTAMVGLYALSGVGLVQLDLVWINPTYLAPQLLGGFLLGVGFIVSGLCPGTAFVSLVSGKLDALVVLVGVFLGVLLFAFGLDGLPALEALYTSGSGEVLTLPGLLGISGSWLAAGVALMALGAFIGAEKVEERMAARLKKNGADLDGSRVTDSRGKYWAMGSLLALSLLAATAAPMLEQENPRQLVASGVRPLPLAERIIAHEPALRILDLREAGTDLRIPGLGKASPTSPPADLLPGQHVVLIAEGDLDAKDLAGWPQGPEYEVLEGGAQAWKEQVLTPLEAEVYNQEALDRAKVQNEICAWFNGTESKAVSAPPPPVIQPAVGSRKKPKGGC